MPISAFTTGFAVSATLIIAIGAQNAFVLRTGAATRARAHHRGLLRSCRPSTDRRGRRGNCSRPRPGPHLTLALTAAGTLFLAWYGIRALSRARTASAMDVARARAASQVRNAVSQAAGFTFLNPHVYLDTVLLIGSIGARQPSDLRLWFVGGSAAPAARVQHPGLRARSLRPVFRTPRAWQVLDTIIG